MAVKKYAIKRLRKPSTPNASARWVQIGWVIVNDAAGPDDSVGGVYLAAQNEDYRLFRQRVVDRKESP